MQTIFSIIPQVLANPQAFFASVQRNEQLKEKAISLFLSTVVFLMTYGFVTGLSHSWMQALSTGLKMPLLFLLTLTFTLPALYFFILALLNMQFSAAQAGVVVLSGIGITAFLLLGLSPITLFFVLTSGNYAFFQLLAVCFVAVSGLTGLSYVLRGLRYVLVTNDLTKSPLGATLLRVWVLLYGFVGAQMTWRLSPLIGDPQQPFALIQPSRDNFFIDVLRAIQSAFGSSAFELSWNIGAFLQFGGLLLFIAIVLAVRIAYAPKPAEQVN